MASDAICTFDRPPTGEARPPTAAVSAPAPISATSAPELQHVPGFREPDVPAASSSSVTIATADEAGVYGIQTVGVTLGSTYTSMEIDTGCSTMQITKTMADSLVARGEAVEAGSGQSLLADGSTHADRRVIINSVSIGGKVITNVLSAVGDDNAAMLLGIATLQRFGKFSIDAAGHQLVLG
jgi:predicted aspartyl protease